MTFRILAPILWIALFLVGLEAALEYRAKARGWETLFFGEPAAAARAGDSKWGPEADFPFRSARIPSDRKPDTARLWFASASYGEDTQLPPDAIFPNRTGELLREQGFACDVLNSSHAGDSILSNVRDLASLGPVYRPDVAVLYEMSNDVDRIGVELCSRGWISTRHPPKPVVVDPLAESSSSVIAPEWAERLFEETTVFKHVKSELTARLSKARPLASTLGDEGEQRFEPRVRAFLAQCRSLGATPVLCTFATAYTRSTMRDTPEEYVLNLLRFNVYLSLEGWLDSIERFNGVIRRIAQEEGVTLVDLERELAGHAELFRDMWHLKEPGHRRAAAALAAALAQLPALAGARAR